MFLLALMEDKMKIMPDQFDQDPIQVLINQIDIKYSNKVLLDVGLCVCFYDFVEVGDPYVYPSEGCAHQFVKFRLIVFKPFVGEIITGKISKSDIDGIHVSMGFFEDILIPPHLLQQPAEFRSDLRLWVWKYEETENSEFILNIGDTVRFKVRSLSFKSLSTGSKEIKSSSTNDSGAGASGAESASLTRKRSSSMASDVAEDVAPAMMIVGSIGDDGLGNIAWWQ